MVSTFALRFFMAWSVPWTEVNLIGRYSPHGLVFGSFGELFLGIKDCLKFCVVSFAAYLSSLDKLE